MEYGSFENFEYEGFSYKSLMTTPYKEIEGCDYYTRIYYKPDEVAGCGFAAIVLGAIQVQVPDDDWKKHEPFSKNDLIILLSSIWASFDGMRHVEIGFDEKYDLTGYIHCLNTDEWIAILEGLRELEKQFCIERE